MSDLSDPDRFRIIERQIRLWESRRAALEEERPGAATGPWITLSTQPGSSGHEVASRVAQRLGWQVMDREILLAVAGEVHVRERVLAHLDEHALRGFENYLRMMAVPEDPGQGVFLREMMKVVWAAARGGRVVLVGRGANWILPPERGVRVRTVAPLEIRVAAVAGRHGLDPASARARVREEDASKADFVRRVYRREIEDPTGYDLVLNTDALGVAGAADVVVAALERKVGGKVGAP